MPDPVLPPDDFGGDAQGQLVQDIQRALSAIGMPPEEHWAWVFYKRLKHGEAAMFRGRLILPKHIDNESGYYVTPAFHFPTTWDPKYQGFSFDAIGRVRNPFDHADGKGEPCPSIVLPPMPNHETGILSPPFVIEAWQRRAFHDPSPVFAQVDWRPGWTEETCFFGGVVPTGENNISHARQGLKIMQWETVTGRPKALKSDKVDHLARAGLKWLAANKYSAVEDFKRPQIGEAINRSLKAINEHMRRDPVVHNHDVHDRMHELLSAKNSPR